MKNFVTFGLMGAFFQLTACLIILDTALETIAGEVKADINTAFECLPGTSYEYHWFAGSGGDCETSRSYVCDDGTDLVWEADPKPRGRFRITDPGAHALAQSGNFISAADSWIENVKLYVLETKSPFWKSRIFTSRVSTPHECCGDEGPDFELTGDIDGWVVKNLDTQEERMCKPFF